jgi:broad-specificity NMP kinase
MEVGISILVSFIFLISGAILGWVVSRYYYLRASEELITESMKLRNYSRLILESLEQAGLVKLVRGESREITGIQFNLKIDNAVHGQTVENVDLVAHSPKKTKVYR